MSTAVILGGSGLIGRAIARRLVASGWDVTIAARKLGRVPRDLVAVTSFVEFERGDRSSLASALGDGADLVVDCVCFTGADAAMLTPHTANAGATVMISSKAVYVDRLGNHVNSRTKPVFDGPIHESNPTMIPGDGYFDSPEGYGANKVAAEIELLSHASRVSVLRVSKAHGEGARPPREWTFAKRVFDGRQAVLLRDGGRAIDHTSAAANIASLVETCASLPGTRVLNAADPDAPSVRDIARVVAGYFGHVWEELDLHTDAPADLGVTPWDSIAPLVLDMSAALGLGYVPAGVYAETVVEELTWLDSYGRTHPERVVESSFTKRYLNYSAEDRYLGELMLR